MKTIPAQIQTKAQNLANKTDKRVGIYQGKDNKWHTFTTLDSPKGITEYIAVTPEIIEGKVEFTAKIEKAKTGWRWAVLDFEGTEVASDIASTKKFAEQQTKSLIGLYKKQSC